MRLGYLGREVCGIVGAVGPFPGSLASLRWMRDLLVHRGPDSTGEYATNGAYLGIRRLRVIDLVTGDQPITNEDGTVHAILNGELYNYRELREELVRRGHRFTTASDTEVLVHGWESFGRDLPAHVEGMFAFAIWDDRTRELVVARDRMGKKPLLYAQPRPGAFVFTSEFRALLADPDVDRRLDPEALDLYLSFGYVPAPRTIYRGVTKLLPGHLAVWRDGRLETIRYWSSPSPGGREVSEDAAAEELLSVMRAAVRDRLIADVPLGAFLSGGVDSSLVVALMAEAAGRVRTFSVGFDERDYSELAHARRVAERYGTEHHELVIRPDLVEVAPLLARHYGEPFADSSAVPTYYLAKLTRQHVTVALSGDGGDEAFAGYDRYRAMRMAAGLDWIPEAVRAPVLAGAAAMVPGRASRRGRAQRASRFLRGAALPTVRRYLAWTGIFDEAGKDALLAPDAPRYRRAAEAILADAMGTQGDVAERANQADLRLYLPDDLLVKMDIASMASSLEARSPFLDRRVVEFGVGLPLHLKMRGGRGKYLLRRVAERFVPRENLYRPKMGFGLPVGEWFRGGLGGLLDDTVLSPRALARGLFCPLAVRALVEQHRAGRIDHTHRLWALVMLELWQREVAGGA